MPPFARETLSRRDIDAVAHWNAARSARLHLTISILTTASLASAGTRLGPLNSSVEFEWNAAACLSLFFRQSYHKRMRQIPLVWHAGPGT